MLIRRRISEVLDRVVNSPITEILLQINITGERMVQLKKRGVILDRGIVLIHCVVMLTGPAIPHFSNRYSITVDGLMIGGTVGVKMTTADLRITTIIIVIITVANISVITPEVEEDHHLMGIGHAIRIMAEEDMITLEVQKETIGDAISIMTVRSLLVGHHMMKVVNWTVVTTAP